jgi:hypothetical protein
VDWIHVAMESQEEIVVQEAIAPTWSETQRTLSLVRVKHWNKSSLFSFYSVFFASAYCSNF